MERAKFERIEACIRSEREEGLEVRHTRAKGRSVFATREFMRGDFVCEYAGEMITYAEAKERETKYARDPSIGCYMYFFEHKTKSYCVDATAETTRLGRLLNHSRLYSNCHTKVFEMDARPYLILLASRDIRAGEELTFDYGDRNRNAVQSYPWLAE